MSNLTHREIFGPYGEHNCYVPDQKEELEALQNISSRRLLQIVLDSCTYAKLRGRETPIWMDLRDALKDHIAFVDLR